VTAAELDDEADAEELAEDASAEAAAPHSCRRAFFIGILAGLGIAVVIGVVRGFLGARRD
jgi:hypothetical protein